MTWSLRILYGLGGRKGKEQLGSQGGDALTKAGSDDFI